VDKICKICHLEKNKSEFYKHRLVCKICVLTINKEKAKSPNRREAERARGIRRYKENPKKINIKNTKSYYKLRYEVLKKYGKACACCGENDIAFLSIDHINGGGHQDFKKLGSKKFYRMLRNNEISQEYRVLCRNCNQSMGIYGYCPHNLNTYKPAEKSYYQNWYGNLRLNVLNLYGHKCQCCGINNYEFLSIDHVKNNGAEERRRLSSERFLAKLFKIGLPHSDYRLLCHNCNQNTWIFGSCPHSTKFQNPYLQFG
jgi:hypothetical protein